MLKYNNKIIMCDFNRGGYIIFSKKWLMFWLVFITIFFCWSFILFLSYCLTNPIPFSDNNTIGALCFSILFFVGYIIIFLVSIRDKRYEKMVKMVLEDPDLVERTVKPFVTSTETARLATIYRIGIRFRIGSKKYLKVQEGYTHLYRAFKDREMEILYSPKYDRVLVLQPSKE